MGIVTNPTYVDDYSKQPIKDFDPEKHLDEFSINGTTYNLILSEDSKKAVDTWLEALTADAEVKTIEKASAATKTTRKTEDRHGLDHVKVRAWAIKNKLKNGVNKDKPITDSSPRLSQHIWDAASASDDADSLKA